MTEDNVPERDVETLTLAQATEEEYCLAALRMRRNETWWYFNGLAPYRGYSRPFTDKSGRWWYCVKPGFAWPLNYFTPVDIPSTNLPKRLLLGAQWPVSCEQRANSRVWMNVIHELQGYDISTVHKNKRRAIRKGLRNLKVEAIEPADEEIAVGAFEVWNSHVERTNWNTLLPLNEFVESWQELAAWPGTTVLAARNPNKDNEICAWLIARTIDSVVYLDTLASHTERLENRPNDTIVFMGLISAARLGVKRAHYSLKSNIRSLEAFKESLGFQAYGFPAFLGLRWAVRLMLRLVKPGAYKRLLGHEDWGNNG